MCEFNGNNFLEYTIDFNNDFLQTAISVTAWQCQMKTFTDFKDSFQNGQMFEK